MLRPKKIESSKCTLRRTCVLKLHIYHSSRSRYHCCTLDFLLCPRFIVQTWKESKFPKYHHMNETGGKSSAYLQRFKKTHFYIVFAKLSVWQVQHYYISHFEISFILIGIRREKTKCNDNLKTTCYNNVRCYSICRGKNIKSHNFNN